MKTKSEPFVSIVTPVYNGADYLRECVESVLEQTYQNWEYTIVDNCSTDLTSSIAREYAETDSRIRIVTNRRLLPIIENHNHTIRQISPDSKYCKMVFADDWLYPTCIEQMVNVAEEDARVGMVGAYMMDGKVVLWQGPSYPARRVPGSEVCRRMLLNGEYVFGTMTGLLLRSDIVRKRPVFFNERNLHADQEACFDLLQESDFGFIHQVLTFSRPREQSNSTFAKNFDSLTLGNVVVFLKYGPVFLTENEYENRWNVLKLDYYRTLAKNVFRLRARRFWDYHKSTLEAFGTTISPWILSKCVITEFILLMTRPVSSFQACIRWWFPLFQRHLKVKSDQ